MKTKNVIAGTERLMDDDVIIRLLNTIRETPVLIRRFIYNKYIVDNKYIVFVFLSSREVIKNSGVLSASLKLNDSDELKGKIYYISGNNGEFKFQIDKGNEISEDKLRKAIERIQEIQDGGNYNAKLTIYRTELASEPDKYIVAVNNEGDAATNIRKSIKTKQKAANPELVDLVNAREEVRELLIEILTEGDVELTKEKAKPAMKLTTYVMKGENVLVVPRANDRLIVKVQKTNRFAQGFFNTIAGFTNAVTNGVETLSGDRVIIDATANKNYQKSFKVANDEIKEMDFEEIKDDLEGEELNMSKGVGGASKRRRNKNNAKDGLTALLIEDGDGITICEGEITEVRESGNKNNIVFVLRPLDGATVSRKKVNGATVNMIFGEVVDSVAAK